MHRVRGVSTDTVKCLSELLEQAREGELVGLAIGAIYRGSNYGVRCVGEAQRNPVFTMGVVDILHEGLSVDACCALQQT